MITSDWSIEKIQKLQEIGFKLYPLKFSQKDGRKIFNFVDSDKFFPDLEIQKSGTWGWIKDYPHAEAKKLYEYTVFGFHLAGILTEDVIVVDTDYKIAYDDFINKFKLQNYAFIEKSVNYNPENCKAHIIFSLKKHKDKLDKTLYKLHDFGILNIKDKDKNGKEIIKSGELLVSAKKNKFILMTGAFLGDIINSELKDAPDLFFDTKIKNYNKNDNDDMPELPHECYFEDDTEQIKNLPIIDVAQKLGLKIDRNNKCKCVKGHDQKTPSMSFEPENNYFHCFGCEIGGSNIDLVIETLNIDTKEAFNWLRENFGIKRIKSKKRTTKKIYFNEKPKNDIGLIDVKSLIGNALKNLEPIDFEIEYKRLNGISPSRDKNDLPIISFQEKIGMLMNCLFNALQKCEYKITLQNEIFYIYNGFYWTKLKDELIEKIIVDACVRMGILYSLAMSMNFRKTAKNQFEFEAKRIEVERKPITHVNLKNCTLEFKDGEMLQKPFNYRDFFTYQLKFDYNTGADCPKFRKYLDRVLPEKELQMVVQEFMGYVFTSYEELKLEKMLVLFGEGHNGKSVFYDIMYQIFGSDNISAFSSRDLDQEHYRAIIVDKLVNYSSEFGKGMNADTLKQLASGEPISARHKYGNPFEARDYAKLIFNANKLPDNVEINKAFFRRFLIIPFNIIITEDEKDPQLAQKIISEELSGVFNWLLEGLKRIIKNKAFTKSKTMDNAIDDYQSDYDSVKRYTESEENLFNDKVNDYLFVKEIYASYKAFCIEDGYRPIGKKNFVKRMEFLGYKKGNEGANKLVLYRKDHKIAPWENK